MPGRIDIFVEHQPDVMLMHLAGHLGIDVYRELKPACEQILGDPAVSELRLDLAAIESTDATAVGMLLVLRERGHAHHKRLSLTRCEPLASGGLDVDQVRRFFNVV